MSDDKRLVDGYQMGKIVTVNEARAEAGLGELMNPDGTPNPDGNLTISQFEDKQYADRRAAQGYGPVPSVASAPAVPAQRMPFKNLR